MQTKSLYRQHQNLAALSFQILNSLESRFGAKGWLSKSLNLCIYSCICVCAYTLVYMCMLLERARCAFSTLSVFKVIFFLRVALSNYVDLEQLVCQLRMLENKLLFIRDIGTEKDNGYFWLWCLLCCCFLHYSFIRYTWFFIRWSFLLLLDKRKWKQSNKSWKNLA